MAYKIILDAGHGGDDPGAVYEGRREKDDNLRLTMAVGQILSQGGVDVVYTRDEDIYQTPFQKAQIANNSGADYFISFHRNSSPMSDQYNGIETLVYDKSGIKYEMAQNINGAVSQLGFKNLGVQARPGLVVLRRTKMPALLVETGFINTEEDNTLFDDRFSEIAAAIANAILGTLDMETVTMPPNTPSRPPEWKPVTPDNLPTSPDMPPIPPVIPEDQPEILYRVQVAAFKNREYADKLLYELIDKGYPAFLLYEDGYYKVQVGAFRNLGNAVRMEQRLRTDGYTTWITT